MDTVEITHENFDEHVERDGILCIVWSTQGWGRCRSFEPVFEAAAARHRDVVFGTIDVDLQPLLRRGFRIRSVPTLMIYRDGLLVFEQAGAFTAAALDRVLGEVRRLDMHAYRETIEDEEDACG